MSVPVVIHFIFPLFPVNQHACTGASQHYRGPSCPPLSRTYIKARTHKRRGGLVIRESVTEFPSVLNFCLFSGQSLGSEPLCGFTSTLSISVSGNRLFPSFTFFHPFFSPPFSPRFFILFPSSLFALLP